MRIIGQGIDIVSVPRIARSIEQHGDRFLERCFTQAERAYADSSSKRRIEHLAARFAAKEAAMKAISSGWRGGIAWTDIEVLREPSGQPTLRVVGEAGAIAAKLGVSAWFISISHTEETAIASAIAVGE